MLKKFLALGLTPLLLAGCTATFTNLTPTQQTRNPNNLYPVEVALTTRQQSLRWETIRPRIVVGNDSFPMRPTPLMTNRWEGWCRSRRPTAWYITDTVSISTTTPSAHPRAIALCPRSIR